MKEETKKENGNVETRKKLSISSTVLLTVIVELIAVIIVGIGFILFY